MNAFIAICLILTCLSLAAVLVIGIFSMTKGGEFNKKYGNRLMRARVVLQGAAIVLLFFAYLLSQR